MKFVVVGATGGVGLEIVAQAIERGHEITALVRKPEALSAFGTQISIVRGDLFDARELQRIVNGKNAVLSGFGPRLPFEKGDNDLLRRFAAALTAAMERAEVLRLVMVSTAFLFKDSVMPPAYLVGRLLFSSLVLDAAGMERTIQESSLNWTIVRPPQLTDEPRSGRYRVREGHLPFFGFKVPRADVAEFMVKCAEQHDFDRKIVGLSK